MFNSLPTGNAADDRAVQRRRGARPRRFGLLAPSVAAALCLNGMDAAQRCSAAVSVTATITPTQVRATMPAGYLGMHTSVYDNGMSNATLPSRLDEAGVQMLRYSGGGYADIFHWSVTRSQSQNGITGGGLSPFWGQAANFGYVAQGADLPSFLKLVEATPGGRATITVNNGSALRLVNGQSAVPQFGGQQQEAAAWVAYANANPAIYGTPADVALGVDQQGNNWKTAGYWARLRSSTANEYRTWATADGVYDSLNSFLAVDHDASYGIKYWEIGNETFGTGYYGGGQGYSVNYDVPYSGNNSQRNANAALSPAAYGNDVVRFSTLMKQVDPTIKVGAVLNTPPDDYSWGPTWNHDVLAVAGETIDFGIVHWYPWASSDAAMFAKVRNDLPVMVSDLRNSINAARADDGSGVELFVTEFELNQGFTPSSPALRPLFAANAYATWLDLGVSSVDWLEMHSSTFLTENAAQTRGPVFHAVSLVDKFARPGDAVLQGSSSNANVSVHAARQADGSYGILLVNTASGASNDASVVVDLGAARHGTTASRYEYGLAQVNANGAPATAQLSGLGGQFTVQVPALSMVTIVVAAPPAIADFSGDGLVDGADFLTWQRHAGTAGNGTLAQGDANGDFAINGQDLAILQTQYGQATAALLAAAIPEPSAAALAMTAGAIVSMTSLRFSSR